MFRFNIQSYLKKLILPSGNRDYNVVQFFRLLVSRWRDMYHEDDPQAVNEYVTSLFAQALLPVRGKRPKVILQEYAVPQLVSCTRDTFKAKGEPRSTAYVLVLHYRTFDLHMGVNAAVYFMADTDDLVTLLGEDGMGGASFSMEGMWSWMPSGEEDDMSYADWRRLIQQLKPAILTTLLCGEKSPDDWLPGTYHWDVFPTALHPTLNVTL